MLDSMTEPSDASSPSDPTERTEPAGQSAAWSDVGARFSALGQKLRSHFEQVRHDEPTPGGGSGEGEGATTPKQDDDALQSALRKLGDAIDGVIDAVGAAVKDPAVKADVKDVGSTLSAAFSKSFAEVSEDLRNAFNRQRGTDGAEGTPPGSDGPGSSGAGPSTPDAPTG